MWDPRQYVDTDFGLEENEGFEPRDDDDTIDATRLPHVMTALGPVEPAELGASYMAEHLLYDVDAVPSGERLDDPMAAIQELTAFVTAGARTLVDVSTRSTGRDVMGLVDIARRVPAHVIVATGGNAETVQSEISEGIGPRKVRPGVAIADTERDVPDLLALGLPVILTRPPRPTAQFDGVALLLEPGWEVGEFDDWPGFYIVTLGGEPAHLPAMAEAISRAVERGHSDRVMIAMGWDRRSRWHAFDGQPGLAFGMERIPLALMEAGLTALDVRKLLVDTPARFLTRIPVPGM
jgi:phosphotriesterase-related protein